MFRLPGPPFAISVLATKTVAAFSVMAMLEIDGIFLVETCRDLFSQNRGKLPDIDRRHSILASRRYQNGVQAHSLAQDEVDDQILAIDLVRIQHLPGFANEIFKKDLMPTQNLSLPKNGNLDTRIRVR